LETETLFEILPRKLRPHLSIVFHNIRDRYEIATIVGSDSGEHRPYLGSDSGEYRPYLGSDSGEHRPYLGSDINLLRSYNFKYLYSGWKPHLTKARPKKVKNVFFRFISGSL